MTRPETITSEYVRGFRAGESSALERAAQIALSHCRCTKDGKSPTPCMTYTAIADGIRALASPAAAPTAEKWKEQHETDRNNRDVSGDAPRTRPGRDLERGRGGHLAGNDAATIQGGGGRGVGPAPSGRREGSRQSAEQVAPPSEPVAPAAITYVNAEQWAAAGQPPLDDKKPREPGCKCHQEEGDSPCPVHGEAEPVAPSLLPRVLAALELAYSGDLMTMGLYGEYYALADELRRYIADQPAAGALEESPK